MDKTYLTWEEKLAELAKMTKTLAELWAMPPDSQKEEAPE